MLTIFVLYIVWMAILLFNVVKEAGAIDVIARSIRTLTGDRVLQLLILSWVFSGFLQSVSGFGVPIAVIAPLLIGLGFSPITAVVAVAIGHSWSVTFGDIGTAFNALIAVTGMTGESLAPWTAGFIGLACIFCGFAVAYTYQGFSTLRRGTPAILLIGLPIIGVQYLLVVNGLWSLAGIISSSAGLVVSALVVRMRYYQMSAGDFQKTDQGSTGEVVDSMEKPLPLLLAISPYLILIFAISASVLVPEVRDFLNRIKWVADFPETQTLRGWITPASSASLSIFGHSGALLAFSSILGYGLLDRFGRSYQEGAPKRILLSTVKSSVSPSLGIAFMVGFAMIMDQSGMTYSLAVGLSRALDNAYPIISPFIGLLGAFMTGSNTNSNIIFGELQRQTAFLLSQPIVIILAAQTVGGALGSMLAPAKIILGCSTTGLAGQEGLVLRHTVKMGVLITAIIGVVAWLMI